MQSLDLNPLDLLSSGLPISGPILGLKSVWLSDATLPFVNLKKRVTL